MVSGKIVAQFFFGQGSSGPDAFRSYLESRPVALLESLERIVPESLYDELDISGWGWVKGLFAEHDGVLEIAYGEVTRDSVSHSDSGLPWDTGDHK